ncbi:long-chain-fatty-acid--CoA ligase [Ktedonospora formicarum]|uniref:Long-chain-fatty-acid--CoA ligase n=1 Tax=Ktedonospora formicarum TaxID=2778364 RepID=A0A8J3HTR3_9CHLR|nr:long-chain fatty acid--CoA ligase [Ktedonospora formicarum]GHO43832.1 long-chain-fatty-acid--CoA ligase [Ktedonospora formicarum]
MSDPSLNNNTPAQPRTLTSVDDRREELLQTRPWLRSYEEGVPDLLDIPDRSLVSLLDTTASSHPGAYATSYFGAKMTYAQLSSLANRFAIGLQRLGIAPGDRVAIALPNIPQFLIAFFGTLRAGAVVVPTNPLYTAHEMHHQMADSGARVMIMLDDYYPVMREARKDTALEHIILTNPAVYLPPVLRTLYPLSQRKAQKSIPPLTEKERRDDPTLHDMQTMLESRSSGGGIEIFHLPSPAKGDDLAVLQYTGGTTGLSKGAMLTHRNLYANALQTRHWTPKAREAKEVTLCVAPFFHAYGLTVGMNLSILIAATMILVPRFKVEEVVDTIRRTHPTLLPGIPTMYIAILRAVGKNKHHLNSIKSCISGAAPLPAKVQADFEAATGGKLVEGYGLSEAAPVTHCNPLTEACRNGSIGLPLPNVVAAILSPATGELLPAGEIGELVVKGPNIMQGYWEREDETKAIFHDGWMRTGDIGKMDTDGFFYVVDRAKDLILASGFNVYPREVEEILYQHPSVAEAAVIGVPHEYRGETVGAFVVLKPGFEPSETTRNEIIAFCKKEMAAYKVPKVVEFRESLPKSLVGKVLRRELRIEKQA